MKKLYFTVLFMLAFAFFGIAQGIDGKWEATIESPQGEMEMTFTFAVDGETLTGTWEMPMMGEVELENGVVSGNEFSFDLDIMESTVTHEGKLEEDVITLTSDMMQGQELTLTRVEEE